MIDASDYSNASSLQFSITREQAARIALEADKLDETDVDILLTVTGKDGERMTAFVDSYGNNIATMIVHTDGETSPA